MARLKAQRIATDSAALRDSQAILRFAHFPSGMISPVRSQTEWPDSTDVSYVVVRDPAGRTIVAYEVPYSESGDWYLITKHYFDSTGRTEIVVHHASFFNGCWDEKGDSTVGIRETLISYYDANHHLAGRDFVRTTFDTTVPAPSGNCRTSFHEAFSAYPTWESLAKANGLSAFTQ